MKIEDELWLEVSLKFQWYEIDLTFFEYWNYMKDKYLKGDALKCNESIGRPYPFPPLISSWRDKIHSVQREFHRVCDRNVISRKIMLRRVNRHSDDPMRKRDQLYIVKYILSHKYS